MQSLDKTGEQLLEELEGLRQRISELEASESRLLGTEKALRESEERFRLLYENAPLGYQSLDENGYFLEVNQAWLDTLGYCREEVVGKWFGDFLAPGYQDHFKINFPKFKAAGEIHWVEFEMLRKDGSQISVAFDGQIGHDERGRFRQTHCILHDISEMKRSQDALKESEQRYRAVVDNLEIGISLINPNMEIVEVNKTLKRYFPNARPACGQICHEQYNDPPKSEPCSYCPCVLTLQDGKVHEAITETPAGSEIRYYHLVSSPIKDSDGRVQYVIELTEDITERKKAQESIDRANQEWERTFNAISDLVMVLDDRHKILRANKAMADALGMAERELIGKCCFELVHGEKEPPAFCPHAQLLADGAEHSAEVVEPRLGGIYDVRVSPLTDQNGQVMGSVHVTRDITQRKLAEEVTRRTEQRLDLALKGADLGLWDLDVQTGQAVVNQRAANMAGYSPDEIDPTLSFLINLIHPDDRSRVMDQLDTCFKGQIELYDVQYRLLAKSGEWKWILSRGKVVERDANGSPLRMTGTFMEVTDRRRAEDALYEAQQVFRTLVEKSPDIIARYDRDCRRTYVNPTYLKVAQIPQQELLASAPIQRSPLPATSAADLQNLLRRVLDTGVAEAIDVIWPKADNIDYWYNVYAFPEFDREGRVVSVMTVSRDITERKRAENIMFARLRLVEYAASHSLDELLQATLDEVESLTHSSIGFYHFLENDQRTLCLQAWSTRTLREMCTAEGKSRHYDIDEAGVWVDCLHERKPVIHNDYSALPHRKGMPAGHADVIRELVVPVFRGDRIVAILGVGNKPVDYGTSDIEAVSLLADLSWDIAERKLAEEALRAASAYNRSLIESSLDPLVTISAHGKITDVNKATELVTGYSRDELVGTDFADYFADPQKARDGYQRAFKEGVVEDYELEIRHRDGHVTPVVYNASMYHDRSGEIVGLFAAARDISRRKQAEEKNLLLAAIVESSDDAIIGKTLDGIITSWNKGAANVYGYADAEAVAKPISLLVPPDRQDEVSQFLERIKSGEHVEHYETVRRKKDGREIDVSLTISPIKNAEGGIIGASTIARDITGQKSLRRQLLQAQKMEAIGTLAGGIAHDFNNLLTVVLGFSELLLIGKDERDASYADLQRIHQAARNGADLVQRILAFGRKTEITPRSLNLNYEIEQAKKLLERTIPKMIEIELLLSDELAMVNADPVQIEQLLMNLAVNAKDAMPDGGKLTIETKNVALDEEYCRMHLGSKPGDYVLLSVSDTGHGIDEETLKHIYEPFYTTKGVGRGTGLGLAMVYGIVKQHGGYTTCYSELGVGTIFKIYLPAIATDAKSEASEGKPALPKGTEGILLVDDEELVRDLGKRILERSGYTVLATASGKEALDLYKKERGKISLVILDLIMPQMGGKQCLEKLLKIDPQVKVLIASGYSAGGEAKTTIESGARGFVGKPYDMGQLLQTVREVLDR